MLQRLKRNVKLVAHRMGVEIYFSKSWNSRDAQITYWLKKLSVGSVIDVGANSGQFAAGLRAYGYRGEIHSFEPTSAAHKLVSRAAAHDKNWHVHPRMAIGREAGVAKIRVAANSYSSSLLPATAALTDGATAAATVSEEEVSIFRLDDVYEIPSAPFMLKIDTEGFEKSVLEGAPKILSQASLACVEMQLVPLYEGASTFSELYALISTAGMQCIGIHSGYARDDVGKVLCVDGIFVREPA